ncbi:hypothetical protein OPQ81_000136 [Rhizoctonia solani]|nr:hypothetical protein OPQ81_000136 [Rhizoctonia solani]
MNLTPYNCSCLYPIADYWGTRCTRCGLTLNQQVAIYSPVQNTVYHYITGLGVGDVVYASRTTYPNGITKDELILFKGGLGSGFATGSW